MKRAIKRWRKAIELRPQYDEAYYSLSRLLMKIRSEEANACRAGSKNARTATHYGPAHLLGNFALTSAMRMTAKASRN